MNGIDAPMDAWVRPLADALAVAAALFALSTMMSWSYYGLKGWTYLACETEVARRLPAYVALGVSG